MMYNIIYEGKQYTEMTEHDLLDAGIPENVVKQAILEKRAKEIKKSCRERIYSVASSETQMNLTAAATVAASKTTSSRSDFDNDVLNAGKLSLQWVAQMRENAKTLSQDPSKNYLDDNEWPACPDEVRAIIAHF